MKLLCEGVRFHDWRLTAFGPVEVRWSLFRNEPRVDRILLFNPESGKIPGQGGLLTSAEKSSCQETDILFDQIERLTNGEETQFSLGLLRLDRCSEFQQRVLAADRSIPRGRVSSYGHISSRLGVSGGARAVGTALATNPFPLVIPCHRAIRSDGSLGGFQGGLLMKIKLLELEGIQFNISLRVENPDFYNWQKIPQSLPFGIL